MAKNSQQYADYLRTLSADEVNRKLGDWCAKQHGILADKNTKTLGTAFGAALHFRREDVGVIANVAAELNGVDPAACKGFDGTLAAIAEATEARGSNSADKIRAYVDHVAKAKEATPEFDQKTKNPLKILNKIKSAIENGKKF